MVKIDLGSKNQSVPGPSRIIQIQRQFEICLSEVALRCLCLPLHPSVGFHDVFRATPACMMFDWHGLAEGKSFHRASIARFVALCAVPCPATSHSPASPPHHHKDTLGLVALRHAAGRSSVSLMYVQVLAWMSFPSPSAGMDGLLI